MKKIPDKQQQASSFAVNTAYWHECQMVTIQAGLRVYADRMNM